MSSVRRKRAAPDVAVVGTGVIGRSWIVVFARAGCQTRVFDSDPKQLRKALAWLEEDLQLDRKDGFLSVEQSAAIRRRITLHRQLGDALRGVSYVQESGPEKMELKQALYQELDRQAEPRAILASSTSGLNMSEIARGLNGAHRCIVAHPVNPPHLIPVVEVLPGRETDPQVVKRTAAFLKGMGQKPVLMNHYVKDFLLNRMQAALIREAVQLVEHGVTDVDGVDAVVRDGLGLRWALMGPFGVANTNADGGVREYFTRYREAYIEGMNDLYPTPSFDDAMIERLGRATDKMTGRVPRAKIRRWRDRMIHKIRALKERDSPS